MSHKPYTICHLSPYKSLPIWENLWISEREQTKEKYSCVPNHIFQFIKHVVQSGKLRIIKEYKTKNLGWEMMDKKPTDYPPPLPQPTCVRILYVSGISPRCWIFRQIQHNLSSQSVSRDGHANQQMLLPVIDAIQELEWRGREQEGPAFLEFWETSHGVVEIWPASERMSLDRWARVETNDVFLEATSLYLEIIWSASNCTRAYKIRSHSSLWSLQWRSVVIIFYILLGAKAQSGQLSVLLRAPLLVNSKTDLPLLLTPKPQDCLLESKFPGLSLQILPEICNWSERQEKRAFDFACTRVTCCFRLAKKCFLHLTL